MTKQEYNKSLEAKSLKEIKMLAKHAAYGTVVHTSGMSRLQMIGFIVNQKYFVEQ
jgi:hypothetical protein